MQRQLPAKEREWLDRQLFEKTVRHPKFQEADCIYAYASLPYEAGTWEIIKNVLDSGKRLALPRVTGKEMKFYYISGFDELGEGVFHIREPKAECRSAKEKNSLMLVPGTAFTKDGKRLGKGGGYYDRFLAAEPDHWTLGLAYGFQIVEELLEESYDRRVKEIIWTE